MAWQDPQTGESVLHAAAAYGCLQLVKQLVGLGADLEARDAEAYTPLLTATRHNQLEVVSFLLEQQVNTNACRSGDYATCLHIAASYGYECLIDAFVAHGIDVDLQNLDGATALHFAAAGQLRAVECLLVRHHANAQLVDDEGMTVLHAVVEYATTPEQDKARHAATCDAVAEEMTRIRVARVLLDHGADIRAKRTTDRASALRCAARHGHLQLVRFLLANGAKSNALSALCFATFCAQDAQLVRQLFARELKQTVVAKKALTG